MLGSGEKTSSRIETAIPAQPMANPASHADEAGNGCGQEGAGWIGNAVREDPDGRVDAASGAWVSLFEAPPAGGDGVRVQAAVVARCLVGGRAGRRY